jgi:hypothetical protein
LSLGVFRSNFFGKLAFERDKGYFRRLFGR